MKCIILILPFTLSLRLWTVSAFTTILLGCVTSAFCQEEIRFNAQDWEKLESMGLTEEQILDSSIAEWETIGGEYRLVGLYIYNWGLKDTLNMSDCTALKKLDCSGNELKALDVSNNNILEELSCYKNDLTVLNLPEENAIPLSVDCDSKVTVIKASTSTNTSKP